MEDKTIPVFTVLKNGAILKNIFVVNSNAVSDDDEVEEILLVGRHPDCDILLTHPSISRYHLQIRSLPSRRKLFVTDLSSVHGTWVADQKVEPDACVEVKEGDVVRIGGSTRIYRLHWIPLSRAYDTDNPFVSPHDASAAMEHDEENITLEAENQEVAYQSLADTASGDGHLDVTSEGSGTSAPSEDGDTYITTREASLPLSSPSVLTQPRDSLQSGQYSQTSTKWEFDFVEAAAEKPTRSCDSSNQQSDSYPKALGSSKLEVPADADESNFIGDGGLLLDVMSGMLESSFPNEEEGPYLAAKETSSLPLPEDSTEIEDLQLIDVVQASPELTENIIEANTENSSGCSSLSKTQLDGVFEASCCASFELATEAETLNLCQEVSGENECDTNQVNNVSAETLTEAENQSYVDNGELEVSRSSSSQSYQLRKIFTEDAQDHLGSGYMSEVCIETDNENLQEIFNGVNPAGDQSKKQGMSREAENLFDGSGSSCHSGDLEQSDTQRFLSLANLKPQTETLFCFESSEASYNLHELWGEGNTDKKVPFPSNLAGVTFEDTRPIEELPSDYTESQETQTEQPHGVRDDALSQMNSSRSGKAASVPLLEASSCSAFELAAEVEILSLREEVSEEISFVTEKILEPSAESLTKVDIQSHEENVVTEVLRQVIAVPSSPQIELKIIGDARGLLGSEVAIDTDSENLHQKSNGETKISSSQVTVVSECLFTGKTEDISSVWSSFQLLEGNAGAPSEILSEVNLTGDQNKISAMNREAEEILDDGSSSCHSVELKQSGTQRFLLTPNQESKTEMSFGSGRSEESYSLSEILGEGKTDKEVPFASTLAAKTFEDTEPTEKLPSDYSGSQENQTPQTQSEMDSSKSSSRRLSTSSIWSRRGKAASVLQVRTNKSEGKQKQIGQPKAQLQRKQALSDKPNYLKLEPEIFTPDKENLTPSSHMLKKLQDIGDVKDSKSFSKVLGKPSSSNGLSEQEIFTPDKENLTPNSHMLKRLRQVGEIKDTKGSSSKAIRKPFFDIHVEENVMVEQKQDVHCMSSNSKVAAHEPWAQKQKVEWAPFQPLLDKSPSQSQSYAEAFSTAAARNNISGGSCSSSNLSYGKNKMKWTIVLDTSSLLDMESRKPLHLLQGLKGTHLIVPRPVLRELNERKRTRCLLFRRTTEMASSALDWIEECKVNTKWWIQVQSPSEETKATAPTPPVTPQSNGSAFPFSLGWNSYAPEIDSPTSEDQVLECALLYRNSNIDEKLVLLSNDVTLKIKAMAEGVICETAPEFYESLKNPFSERFMWPESLPRGRTWSHTDDVVLRERYNNRTCFPNRKKPTFNGGRRGESGAAAAKGLKLILLHNSHYGHIH